MKITMGGSIKMDENDNGRINQNGRKWQWEDQSIKWTKITMGRSINKMGENDNGRINQDGRKW
jgi:hypothetical protein